MKVILKQDIKGIGKKDEIHEVSDAIADTDNCNQRTDGECCATYLI